MMGHTPSRLIRARNDGRHLPESHPVRQRLAMREIRAHLVDGRLPEVALTRQSAVSHLLESMAVLLASLPDDTPLSVGQRRDARIIARQLLRLAGSEVA